MSVSQGTRTPDPPPSPNRLEQVVARLPLAPPHPCNYLPGETAQLRGLDGTRLPAELFDVFLEIGWRRSGCVLYQPRCPTCRACIPIRVPVGRFVPSRSQRRVLARNHELRVALSPALADDERGDLYQRYVTSCHRGPMTGEREELESFLADSPFDTVDLEVRDPGHRLLAVMTIDRAATGWNCVYCYYEPDVPARSLGTYTILRAIEQCARHCPAGADAHLYLGYWVPGSLTMAYKAAFRPHQIRQPNGEWTTPS